jgi:alpha-ketoglutarate-dependent taurine dioxygenase
MSFEITRQSPGTQFGAVIGLKGGGDAHAVIESAKKSPDSLAQLLAECEGLMVLKGMDAIADDPALLARLSEFFGPEVEDYRHTLTRSEAIHTGVPEIMLVSNIPPTSRKPPPMPDPPLAADGKIPVQYPHRKGWHTDQSYRRPPPDISLFFAMVPVPKGQGQTMFANGTAAYAALSPATKARIDGMMGLHVQPGSGRSRDSARAGETPRPLAPHEKSQPQPIVRIHPVSGKPALYLCEHGQMDWVDGPIVGMEPGPDGGGGKLLDELMSHLTQRQFVYVHEWDKGDVVIWDNRCLVHAATWFDADKEERLMWRTTVHGNPGAFYAGEEKSWIPQAAAE